MPILLFNNLTETDKSEAVKKLIGDSAPRQEFFLMVLLSILMATFGIIINNITVVIGSMLIAPMLYPIMGLALGVVMSDSKLITRSLATLAKSIIIGLVAAALVGIFTDPILGYGEQDIIKSAQPSLAYAAIAIIAGLAASFALVNPKLNESLPGIAISVALIPPLAITGIGFARFDWNIISQAFTLFLINIIGITFASVIIFSLMNLYVKRNIANRAIDREDKEMAKEVKKIEKEKKKSQRS
ncbi:MAG: TIGR00341 family protein [bacterium]